MNTSSLMAPGAMSGRRARAGPASAGLAAAVSSLLVSAAIIARRPDLTVGAAFLFGDEAANLFVADALHAGRRLYQEVAYPYGPLPIFFYAAVAELLGNAPSTYLASLAIASAISAGMAAWVIQRAAGLRLALVLTLLGLLPAMPLPGASIGGYTSSMYMPIERVLLLAAALLWQGPAWRPRTRSFVIGAILAATQGVRFGSGVVGLVAVITIDAVSAIRHVREAKARRDAVNSMMWLAAGFAVVQIGWLLAAFLTLPAAFGMEFLWPMHLWETHQASGAPRWPTWIGWPAAITQYALPGTAVILAGAGLLRWVGSASTTDAGSRKWDAEGAASILLVFVLLGSALYFRHEHHFRQFAWMLVPAAAAAIGRLRAPLRLALLVIWIPALWPMASAIVQDPPPETARLEVPAGYTLFTSAAAAARVEFLERHVVHDPVLFVPNGTGWLFAYRHDHVTRHAWFYSRAVVRTFEEEAFVRGVAQAATVVACEPAGPFEEWPLPEAAVTAIENGFTFSGAGGGCRIWIRSLPAGDTPPGK